MPEALIRTIQKFIKKLISASSSNEQPKVPPVENVEKKRSSSEIKTDYLHITLDESKNELDAVILKGPFSNQTLSRLGVTDILQIRKECKNYNYQNITYIENYLDNVQPKWRDNLKHHNGATNEKQKKVQQDNRLSIDEAYAVLGLHPGASYEQIRQAHRNLMKKVHPDQGGSSYLAAQINHAKDFLLNEQNVRNIS